MRPRPRRRLRLRPEHGARGVRLGLRSATGAVDPRTVPPFVAASGSVNDEWHSACDPVSARFREGEGLVGNAWKARDLDDLLRPGRAERPGRVHRPRLREPGSRVGVAFPIIDDDNVIGAMDFFATEMVELTAERQEVLRTVGRLVSSSIRVFRIADSGGSARDGRPGRQQPDREDGNAQTADQAVRVALDSVREAFGWAYGSFSAARSEEKQVLKTTIE